MCILHWLLSVVSAVDFRKKKLVANEVWCSKSVFCNFYEGLCIFRLALRLVCITWTLDKQKNTTAQNIILQPTFTHIEEKKVFKSSECLMQGHYTIPLCLKNTIIHFICRVSQYWYTSKDRNWFWGKLNLLCFTLCIIEKLD